MGINYNHNYFYIINNSNTPPKANTDGAGLGGGESLGINNKKRFRKTLFQTTIIVSILFVVFNLFALFIR